MFIRLIQPKSFSEVLAWFLIRWYQMFKNTNKKTMNFKLLMTCSALFILAACVKNDEPTIDERDQYMGTYTVTEISNLNATLTFDVELEKRGNSGSDFYIKNIYDTDLDAVADLSGRKFVIEKQTLGNWIFQGYGSVSDTSLSMTYEVFASDTASTFYDYVVTEGVKK